MWREHWTELMAAIRDVARSRHSGPRFTHSIELVMRVYFFAVFHQAPLSWASLPRHWPRDLRPATARGPRKAVLSGPTGCELRGGGEAPREPRRRHSAALPWQARALHPSA